MCSSVVCQPNHESGSVSQTFSTVPSKEVISLIKYSYVLCTASLMIVASFRVWHLDTLTQHFMHGQTFVSGEWSKWVTYIMYVLLKSFVMPQYSSIQPPRYKHPFTHLSTPTSLPPHISPPIHCTRHNSTQILSPLPHCDVDSIRAEQPLYRSSLQSPSLPLPRYE
jgi:hypothetical protein